MRLIAQTLNRFSGRDGIAAKRKNLGKFLVDSILCQQSLQDGVCNSWVSCRYVLGPEDLRRDTFRVDGQQFGDLVAKPRNHGRRNAGDQ